MKKHQKIYQKQNLQQSKLKQSLRPKQQNKPLSKGIWLFGKHSVFLALQKKRREIFEILVTKNSVIELENFLAEKNLSHLKTRLKLVEARFIDSIVGSDQIHQGLALNCSTLALKSQNNLLDELENARDKGQKMPPLLIMDQLRDPHNVGAIIRSACAFGVKKIIFPEHNFPKESAVMSKSSVGMIENVDLFLVVNLNNLMAKLKELNYWCVGLAGEAKDSINKIREYKNIALIIGSEGEGIRDLVKRNCDLLVKIEMDRDVESLNASVAASIALREIFIGKYNS